MTSSPVARVTPLQSGFVAESICIACVCCGMRIGNVDYTGSQPAYASLRCIRCGFQSECVRGIWMAIPENRLRHYQRFINEYQIIREREGRGSADAEFYLALPYKDLTGANQQQWNIRSRTFDYLDLKVLNTLRPRAMVLDLGAGNGWLSYRLALRKFLPIAVDLLTNDFDGLGAASHYLGELSRPFPRFRAELDRLPFGSNQFDCAIFNASFHYSEDYAHTLKEAIRCLRVGGLVVIADTPWYSRNESGQQMLEQRREQFRTRFGFPSDGLASLEYLTDARLEALAKRLGLRWSIHTPNYGIRWAARPWIAKLRQKREPSQFRIYTAEVTKR